MTDRVDRIKDIYEGLLRESGSPGQRVHVRIDRSSPIKIHAACVFPHKHLMLEIGPVKNAWLPEDFRKPRIKGLGIILASSEQLPRSNVTVLLELQQNEAIDVFSVFVARVCDELDKIVKPESAVSAILGLIDKWKEFFSGGTNLLNEERQTGLFGELYLLRYLVTEGIDYGKVVGAWTGSRRTSQDYEFGATAMEIKSSVAVDPSTVNITNARQLDDGNLGNLYLVRAVFDVRQSHDLTLPILVDELRSDIQQNAPEAGLDFEEKLVSAGYSDKDREYYANRSYTERDITFYKITEGFPRILENDLPEGVTKVSYELTLDACRDFIADRDNVIESVRTGCD